MAKRAAVVGGIVALLAIVGIANSGAPQTAPTTNKTETSSTVELTAKPAEASVLPAQEVKTEPAPAPTPTPTPAPSQSSTLSNDNHYTNSAGNTVHSPAYSNGGVPAGATAECKDGTYSFSQSRRGTCSGHGGVAAWL